MGSKSIGSSAGLLALIAVIIHTLGSPDSDRHAGQKEPQAMPDLSAFASHSQAKELPVALQGPWSTTQQYFHTDPTVDRDLLTKCLQQSDESCLGPLVYGLYGFPSAEKRPSLKAFIATVPDPLHTRMSLETDRYLDAIQQAAFDSGYELASQWLPWTVKAAAEKTGAVLANTDKSFDWERLPGLLLFRHHFFGQSSKKGSDAPDPDSLLLVFVVGETPTTGVNGYQFSVASATIRSLFDASAQTLYIAGPNFSGSFPSVTHLLEQAASNWRQVEIRSGTVTNDRYAAQMLTELQSKFRARDGTGVTAPSISFYSSAPPSSSFRQQFTQLMDKLHIKPWQTAEIMETETGFAAREDDQASPFPILRYPRDIAQLRNSYNDAAFASSAGQTGTASPPPVDFSLKDTQAGEDEFPTFSTSHTPISQNAVLEQIAHRVKHNHLRLVALSASNVFDALFLANYLTRNCPDTRVVLPSADLLFVEDAIAGRLAGLMAISPFPLFPEGTTPEGASNGGDINTFASTDQAAEFNSVLSLLGMMSRDMGSRVAKYRQDYGPVLADGNASSAWVLVLSSRGWMPVDLFSQEDKLLLSTSNSKAGDKSKKITWWDPSARSRKSVSDSLSGLRAGGPLWLVLSASIALFTIMVCYRIFHLRRHPEERVWSSFCLEDPQPNQAPSGSKPAVDSRQVLRSRYFCMTACFSNLAVANALFLCPMLANNHGGGFHYWAVLALLCVAFGWAAMTSALLVRSWIPVHTRSSQSMALNLGLQLIALSTIGSWCYCCFFNGPASTMFSFRTLELAGSVCPLWPLLLVTLGLIGMAFFQLRRFTWCDRRQPYLDTSLFDNLLKNEFTETRERLETFLMSPTGHSIWKATREKCGATVQRMTMLCWPFGLLVIVVLVLGDSLLSFESQAFTYTVEGLCAILAVFTLSNLFRFLICWKTLRAFLTNLNSIVLGRSFRQVSEFSGSSGPIWVRDVKLMSLSTVVNGYIALHNLDRLRARPFEPGTSEYRDALQKFLAAPQPCSNRTLSKPRSKPSEREQFVQAYRDFRKCANRISVELGENILKNYWLNNHLDFVAVDDSDEAEAPVKTTSVLTPAEARSAPLDLEKAMVNPSWKVDRLEFVAMHQAENAAGSPAQRPFAMAATVNSAGARSTPVDAEGAIGASWAVNRLEFVASDKPGDPAEAPRPGREEYVLASRYVTLHYSAYIGYILHQLQNLLVGSTVCFVLLMLSLNSFVFQAPQTIFHLASAVLIISGIMVLMALAQMERDPILSRLSGSKEGELGKDFYVRALSFGILPILTVLGTEFPSIAQYVSTWIQPMSAALH